MAFDGITIHEGYNDIGTFQYDITSVEIESETGEGIKVVTPPVSENLLFKVVFDPSGNPVPPDYTVKLDLTPLNDITAISSELIDRGGKQIFSFTLSNNPVKAGSLTITDGLETFTDNGDGTLRGSEGGSGTINYTTGAGSVTFFAPPVFGDNIVANYKKQISVSGEDLGASGTTTTYNLTLAHGDVVPTSFTVTIGTVTLTDNGSGALTGTGGSGTINYATGALTINLTTVPSGHFMANYTYWGAASSETIGTGALTASFNFKLVHHPIIVGSLSVIDGTETFSDNSDGTLTGSLGGSGTINYDAGVGTLSFTTAPAWGIEITANYNTGNVMLETQTNNDGFIQINVPVYPVVTVKSTGDTFIDFDVVGTLDDRQDELYLMLDGGGTGPIYTLITDMFVKSGYLQVFDGDTTYYKIYPNIAIGSSIAAVKINEKGKVSGYDSTTHQWSDIDTLTFHSIQHPEFLDIVSDGFYSTNTSTGTDTSGHLGDTSTVFEHFKGVVNNPEPYYISVGVSVFEPDAAMPVKMQDFAYLMPGDTDYHVVKVTADAYVAPDQTPTLNDIESITGVAFSTAFRTFLSSKGINTLDSARRAGPITYINGFPSTLSPDEVALLQSHVDLYSINQDATQNQIMIAAGYGDIFKIANTARNAFLNDVVGTSLPLYTGAEIYEQANQNLRLIGNLLAGTITDLQLANPSSPSLNGSNFAGRVFAGATNSCGCDDCKSGISPFAYLLDLLKYGAAHIKHNSSPTYDPASPNFSSFNSLMETVFLQPFGTLNVDCNTLHHEYCRVRLVTEVLEKWVNIQIGAGAIPLIRQQKLESERQNFLMLVYRSILNQAGTSFDELRSVHAISPLDKKIPAAQKLTDKLGIPLYMPSDPTTLTTDRMWLYFNGGAYPNNDLTAGNLELVFGFRDTQRNVLTDTPTSLMEDWKKAFLRTKWMNEDYLFSSYSREGADPLSLGSFKSNWKPIVDPDITGHIDLSHNPSNRSSFVQNLWNHRKDDTDQFLDFCVKDPSNLTRVSVDFDARTLKVTDRDLTAYVFDGNEVKIEDENSPGTWVPYNVIGKKLVSTDTNIVLSKTYGGSFQQLVNPNGATPTMRFKRVLNVDASYIGGSGTTVVITFPQPILFDPFTGGYTRFESTAGSSPYETYPPGVSPLLISGVSYSPGNTVVTLTLTTPGIDPIFTGGSMKFIYEAEVPLYTTKVLDPEDECNNHFSTLNYSYSLLPTAPGALTDPFDYTLFGPVSWPVSITASTYYGKLKQMQQLLSAGITVDTFTSIINNDLHLSVSAFNKMMLLFENCEKYKSGLFSAKMPTEQELYELASIFRSAGRALLQDTWVKEEYLHLDPSSNPYELVLSAQQFWKSIHEPQQDSWDSTLQTIPATVGAINTTHIPIIEPEIYKREELNDNVICKAYLDLYDSRATILQNKYNSYYSNLIPYNGASYENALNEINTGSPGTTYTIPNYATLADLVNDLQSNDAFKLKKSTSSLMTAFGMTREDFLQLIDVKGRYESNDPNLLPSPIEIGKSIKLLVSAFKKMQFYPTTMAGTGWIEKEVAGTFAGGGGILLKYYKVLKLRLAPGRTDESDRIEWQRTLSAWNRLPFIQPDIAAPENILGFVPGNWVYTTWNSRNNSLISDYGTLSTSYLYPGVGNCGVFFSNFKDQLDLIIARDSGLTPYGGTRQYLPYFEALDTKESDGEDIRPYLEQYGIVVQEYRYLKKIYDILGSTNPSFAIPLIPEEYDDIRNVLLAIRSRNLSINEVIEEFNQSPVILLDEDFFQAYKPALNDYPVTDLPLFNKWRSPSDLRKVWIDTLQSRIDAEKAVMDRWNEILERAEDSNMPLLRDALIRALTGDCEKWEDVAERLAKSFFIETKDNCCVKHTRVSFAIETMQSFFFALQNGIYDDFINDFLLIAPNFDLEWRWLGSYGSWRSAMFVFLYPENLLYPTLKRRQSEGFIKLAGTIRDSVNFGPDDACIAADGYIDYLNEIESIKVVCSASTRMRTTLVDPGACCEKDAVQMDWYTYYFGQGGSGKIYWCYKQTDDASANSLNLWSSLPIDRENVTIVSSNVLADRAIQGWYPTRIGLYLFYTFWEDDKLKLAYICKELFIPGSDWQKEKIVAELPQKISLSGIDLLTSRPIHVTGCQNGIDWENPYFIITYDWSSTFISNGVTLTRAHRHFTYDYKNDLWNNGGIPIANNEECPVTGIRHQILKTQTTPEYTGLTFVFKTFINVIYTEGISVFSWPVVNPPTPVSQAVSPSISEIICAYESRITNGFRNPLIIFWYDTSGIFNACKLDIYGDKLNTAYPFWKTGFTSPNISQQVKETRSVYPQFFEDAAPREFGIKLYAQETAVGSKIFITGTGYQLLNLINPANTSEKPYSLIPEKGNTIPIQSADCITNLQQRALEIKNKFLPNLNSPFGTSVNDVIRSRASREYLNEAYYFIPMLIALDQQRRGQYNIALNWYRSIYDYTNSLLTNRKIFYGLVLEQSTANVFNQAPNWLLDPLNPHLIAETRTNAYCKYTLMNIIQCFYSLADREFTLDTIESVPRARIYYTTALELLKVPELELTANLCENDSNGCTDTQTNIRVAPRWGNVYRRLQQDLVSLGDATLIESLTGDIVGLINGSTEDTYAANFADAFQLIEDNRPSPATPQTVTQVLNGLASRVNNSYSYFMALNDPTSYNLAVRQQYALTVAGTSGLNVDEVSLSGSGARISWLTNPIPSNDVPMTFAFTNGSGAQNLSGNLTYDPFSFSTLGYMANANYANANVIAGRRVSGFPLSYTPLIDFTFCTAFNPVYRLLLLKGNIEIYKIHNCRNIAGIVRELSVFASATDSSSGIPVIGASGTLSIPGPNNYSPSQYKYQVLIERAKQLANNAQQFESLFLAALEKEDAENYAQLRANQDLETARQTVTLQDLRIAQAQDEETVAQIQLSKSVFVQNHYNDLIAAGLNNFEEAALNLMQDQIQTMTSAVQLSDISTGVHAITGIASGNVGDLGSSAFSLAAQLQGIQSSLNSMQASFERREQEWQFQSNLAQFDINIANQQIKVSEDSTRIVTQEREIAVLNTTHAQDSLEFLKNKFTNAELYHWMGGMLEGCYNFMLNLATSVAKTAEAQLAFERQEGSSSFILNDYWEAPSSGFTAGSSDKQTDRKGLTGSARLLVDITRLEQHALDSFKRKLQMTKVISLSQNFPAEFQLFKETGVLNFELTNTLFDYDFPGHYLRLINGVRTSVIGLIPLYDNIKANLTADSISYTVIGGNSFQKIPIRRLELDSVALTGSSNATGVFELQSMQGQIINPFEGMGVESRWEFKMPMFSNRMDFGNIADIILSVDYTALDSYLLRTQVLQELDNTIKFSRGFSFKNHFPDQWYELGEVLEGPQSFDVTIDLKQEHFPQGIDNIKIAPTDILLYFVREDGFEDEIEILNFNKVPANSDFGGETIGGVFHATNLTANLVGQNPVLSLKLAFDNTIINRTLFTDEKVTDMFLLINLRGELKSYPL